MFGKKYACKNCQFVGFYPKTKVRGNVGLELGLYIFFIIPGILYSLWRAGGAYKVCPQCGSKEIVPMGTPAAEALAKSFHVSK